MAKNKVKTLADLKALKFKDEKKEITGDPKMPKSVQKVLDALKKKPEVTAESDPEEVPIAEEMAFMNAMSGVERMESSTVQVERTKPATPTHCTDENGNAYKSNFVDGRVEFELDYSEEFMFGHVCGIDTKIFQKLKAGSYSNESRIDLHGMTSDQAFDNLTFFIRESYLHGCRCILAVTGKGKNSPGGQSVLKREMQSWLTRDPFRRVVLAFCTAQPKDGGAGAVYILLRNQKKVKDNVTWDKGINWDK